MKYSILVLLLSMLTCDSIAQEKKYFRKEVVDSLYESHMEGMTQYFEEVFPQELILKDLEATPVILKDIASTDFDIATLKLDAYEEMFDEEEMKKVHRSQMIYAYHKQNFGGEIALSDAENFPFDLFDSGLYCAELRCREALHNYWQYYKNRAHCYTLAGEDNTFYDKRSRDLYITIFDSEVEQVYQKKYFMTSVDLFIIEPDFQNNVAEQGLIINISKLYDLKTKKKLAEKLFVIKNTNDYKIDYSKKRDRLDERIIKKIFHTDLNYLRNKTINDYFYSESPIFPIED